MLQAGLFLFLKQKNKTMKTNLFIAILLFSIHCIGFTQINEWAPLGTEWHYGLRYGANDAFPGSDFYYHFEITKDTVVLGKNCRIMQREIYDDDGGMSTDNYYTYSNNDSVYLYRPNEEIDFRLVFDYTAEQGDTLTFYGYNPTAPTLYDTSTYIVLELSTIDLGGEPIKKWTLQYAGPPGGPYFGFPREIYESVGNLHGFDFNYGFIIGPPISWELRCFSDGLIDYTSGTTCDTIILSNEDISNKPELLVNVYPNPVDHNSEFLTIGLPEFSIKKNSEIRLTNSLGQTIKYLPTPYSDYLYKMEVADLSPGIYFLNIVVDGKILQSQRVQVY